MAIIHLSATKISSYSDCPHKYWLRYVKQMKGSRTPHLRFGLLIHKIMEEFHKWVLSTGGNLTEDMARMKAKEICEKQLQAYKAKFRFDLAMLKYDNMDIWENFVEEYIEYFLSNKLYSKRIYPEVAFNSKIADKFLLRGKLDLFIDPNIVIDFKTGSTVPTAEELKDSLQVKFYSIVKQQPTIFNYIFLKKPMTFRAFHVIKPNNTLVDEIINKAQPLIRSKDFPKSHRNCEYCNYRHICRPDIFKKSEDISFEDESSAEDI